jgi:hypothetical protein
VSGTVPSELVPWETELAWEWETVPWETVPWETVLTVRWGWEWGTWETVPGKCRHSLP